jgi:hypothetical protein
MSLPLGAIAIRQFRRNPEKYRNKGLAYYSFDREGNIELISTLKRQIVYFQLFNDLYCGLGKNRTCI